MSRHLIIINGRSGSGKDTFVEQVLEALKPVSWHKGNLSSITPVYEMLQSKGIPMMPKTVETRQLAADTKRILNGYNRWADKLAVEAVKTFGSLRSSEDVGTIVFLHVRELDSIKYITANMPFNWKVSTLWVDREVAQVANDEVYNPDHYTFMITNTGTLEDLKAQAIEFAKKFDD